MVEDGHYVYFITDGHNHVKIGVTSGKAEGRLSQLQTGNPFKLKMYERIFLTYSHLSAFDVEKTLHEKFKNYRLEGEWFLFEPVKKYLDWLRKTCEENKKKDLSNITNLTAKYPKTSHDFFIFGKYRTSTTKETILCAELLKGGDFVLGC